MKSSNLESLREALGNLYESYTYSHGLGYLTPEGVQSIPDAVEFLKTYVEAEEAHHASISEARTKLINEHLAAHRSYVDEMTNLRGQLKTAQARLNQVADIVNGKDQTLTHADHIAKRADELVAALPDKPIQAIKELRTAFRNQVPDPDYGTVGYGPGNVEGTYDPSRPTFGLREAKDAIDAARLRAGL